ncbi:MFS transporter [Amycolatopsis sp. FDAARGOS 1241]|uniref:MFS transporter n=1 Tax=Amycolatopsis sp. FDAARGOS 1241 TaxID=2778070 RepID=UPI00195269E0|nr:MFS transporter [Amycolatopsis sp. FDAARGOS 1241]QRP47402.1 MFS transporter [Amycolatopsis sp. FDAARGOS 1241]
MPEDPKVVATTTCAAASPRGPPTDSALPAGGRGWVSVAAVALGAFVIITTETLPVGLLPDIAAGLGVSLGLAGLLALVPGLSAAVAAPLFFLGAGWFDRRTVILALGLLVLASNAIVAVAPNFAVVLLARVLLGAAVGAFWTVVTPVGPKLARPARGTRAISIIAAGVSGGMVVGLPAGQFFGTPLGWRVTFAAAGGAALLIVLAQALLLPRIPPDGRSHLRDLTCVTSPAP